MRGLTRANWNYICSEANEWFYKSPDRKRAFAEMAKTIKFVD
mgnify:CR=1 FL=1